MTVDFANPYPSMLHLLEERQHDTKPRMHIYNGGKKVSSLSYQQIFERAQRHARVIAHSVAEDQGFVLLEGSNDAHFVINFFAVQMAGYIPVPVATNLWVADDRYREIISSIADTTKAVLLIANGSAMDILSDNPQQSLTVPFLESNTLSVRAEDVRIDNYDLKLPDPHEIAYLQFSSGSTGRPKGVIITHYNAMANITQLDEHLNVDPENDVTVCWLPVHHDMGLLAGYLIPLFNGLDCHMMNPYDFAVNPNRWLKLVSQVKASIITGPNSAFHMAAKKMKPAHVKKLDLSSVRVAMCAAEPVNAKTLTDFYQSFRAAGFKDTAFLPAYGLAENTLGVSLYDPEKRIHIDRISKTAFFKKAEALPCNSEDCLEFVACGKPLRGVSVKVVDDSGKELPERSIGNILISGPSTTSGYHDREDLNSYLFIGSMLATGDLGYVADGEIYITGRKKDVIIINGQNINAEEVEGQAIKLPEVRAGRIVAFAVKNGDSGSERIHVLLETRPNAKYLSPVQRNDLRKRFSQHLSRFVSIKEDQITVLPPGAILKTTSGKVRRGEMKSLYEQGSLSEDTLSFTLGFAEYKATELQTRARLMLERMNPANALS